MSESVLSLLKKYTVADLVAEDKAQEVLVLYTGTSVREGLEQMKAKGCTSAPVKDFESRQYIGMLSVLDVVSFAIDALGGWHALKRREFREFASLVGHAFFETDVGEIAGKTHTGPFPYIPVNYTHVTLDKLFEQVFAREIHRVPIADATESIVHILSQSNAVRFVHKHIGEMKRAGETIEELGMIGGRGTVVTVRDDTRAIEALRVILSNKVQGVAIVKHTDGTIVGSFSASDLKLLTEDGFQYLTRPVVEFITIVRAQAHHRTDAIIHVPKPVTVTASATLAAVVKTVVEHKIHRVFVVDEENKPIGIVTLTDIIEALLV